MYIHIFFFFFSSRTKPDLFSKLNEGLKRFSDQSTEEIRQAYGYRGSDTFQRNMQLLGKTTNLTNITGVLDAMEHALLSQNPKSRYVPRKSDFFFTWILSSLPYFVSDVILDKV